MKSVRSYRRLSAVAGLAFLLAISSACSPVGIGSGPTRIEINAPNGTLNAASARVFQCFRSALTANLFFTDGSAGDFTSRATWVSSNPAVARVSNGDEPVPELPGRFFTRGTLTPVADGTATITASFSGITDTIEVSVGTPQALTVRTVNSQNGLLSTPPAGGLRIGPGTFQLLAVTAVLDNVETNISTGANWDFVTPNTAVATIDPVNGLVVGVAAGGPLTARANFPCPQTATVDINVLPIRAIAIQPEFGADPLVVGNTEHVNVLADFGNGPEQDISLSSTLTSSQTTVAQFSTGAGLTNLLGALAAGGPVNLTATFPIGPTPAFTAPAVALSTVAATLQSIAVTPASASVVAGSDQVQQFNAIGSYSGSITQDVTRLVAWSTPALAVGQPRIAVVSNALATAGQARSASTTPGTVTITATVPGTTTPITATAQFTTTAPAP